MRPDDILARAQKAIENLNSRERLLLGVMGSIFTLLLILTPLVLLNSSIDDLDDRNDSISTVLRDIRRAGPVLAERQAEREARARLYERKAPALGSFLEGKAGAHSLTIREVNDSPEQTLGDYTRRHVRVSFTAVPLLPVVEMMTEIENSRLPVAIDRIQIEHFREGNNYNVKIGVAAYDAEGAELGSPAPASRSIEARDARRRAGAEPTPRAAAAMMGGASMGPLLGMRRVARPNPTSAEQGAEE